MIHPVLDALLTQTLPGLEWPLLAERSLFHQAQVGLRFELNHLGAAGLGQARQRASALYEATFTLDEPVTVVAGRRSWPEDGVDLSSRRGPLFELNRVVPFGLHTSPSRVEYPHAADDPDGAHNVIFTWESQVARTLDHRLLFEAIANRDFRPRCPAVTEDVYLLSPKRGLMFCMYDDRGVDIVATRRATLQPLYDQFSAWLLDYDRARMEQVFA